MMSEGVRYQRNTQGHVAGCNWIERVITINPRVHMKWDGLDHDLRAQMISEKAQFHEDRQHGLSRSFLSSRL